MPSLYKLAPWLPVAVLLLPISAARAQTPLAVRPIEDARVPDLTGVDTGLLQVPTAYVQPQGQMALSGSSDSHHDSAALLAGVSDRVEIAASLENRSSNDTTAIGAAKWNLIPERLLLPAVSVGIINPFDAGQPGRSGYVVVSKDVIPYFVEALTGQQHLALKLHAGYGSGGPFHQSIFLGAEVIGSRGLSGIGELVAGRANLGARYTTRQGFGVTLSLLGLSHIGGAISYRILPR